MYSKQQVHTALISELISCLNQISASSEMAAVFANREREIAPEALLRHTVEHVFRIRGFRAIDLMASKSIRVNFPDVAEQWYKYARSEAVHDRYYIRDLAAMGVSKSELENLTPFNATNQLHNFINLAMENYGTLPVVIYSYWAEQNSDIGTPVVVDKVNRRFGESCSKGALAHHYLDHNLDHADLVLDVLCAHIQSFADLTNAVSILRTISALIAEYFQDLEMWLKARDQCCSKMSLTQGQ